MAGIYIHIPFCKQKCHYCDFHFSTTFESYYDEMVSAIAQDIQNNTTYLKDEVVETVYFGGGTPSLLQSKDLAFLIGEVKKSFNCDIRELTLEMNPDDMEDSYLQDLKSLGFNRLSIGIQSFDDAVLSFMNRAHNANEAINCVDRAKAADINNISIDLIYGIPNVTKEYWKDTVRKALSLGVQHISAYCLTIEENTAFSQMVRKGVFKTIPEERELEQFEYLNQELMKNDIHRYEVSNFSKDGFESKHNSAYWSKKKYLGVGPSAHSYDGESRKWNLSHNRKYLKLIAENEAYFESETLSKEDVFNETLLTGLRTKKGVSLNDLDQNLRTNSWSKLLQKMMEEGLVQVAENRISIPDEFLFQADGIAARLFI